MSGVLIGIVIVALLAATVTAVLAKNLLVTAAALGLGSVALATLFFLFESPYAGGFELSVGAGLISVLFIVAISLVESLGKERDET